MRSDRLVRTTARVLAVMVFGAFGLVRPLGAEEEGRSDPLAVDRALRRAVRAEVPLAERLALIRTVLAGDTTEDDAEALLRAGAALLADAPEPAGWLLLRGREAGWVEPEVRAAILADVQKVAARSTETEDARLAAVWTAAAYVLGARPDEAPARLTASWPPPAFVRGVLRREVAPPPGGDVADAEAWRRAAEAQLETARALDLAEQDDVAAMHAGLDALMAISADALPLLFHVVRSGTGGAAPGRLERITRAVLALGLLQRREATPVLIEALDAPNGWIQAAAATALGDLGDPAAAIALCRKMTYRGEILRPRDQWDYPGERETNVAREDWASVEYYAVDCAAADALLRLGLSGGAGWLIQNRLDPARANYRVRVLQDAADALRRALPDSPAPSFNPDSGLPGRRNVFEALERYWKAHASDPDLLAVRFDASDENFRREARRMVERLRGRSIMELQISQETCALLGPAATETLLEVLAATKNRVLRTEIARALGVVRDPRAVEPLLGLAADRAAFLRAVAADALGHYLGHDARADAMLVRLLDDPEGAPRVAALTALVATPPSDAFRAVLQAHDVEAHRVRFSGEDRDYRMAWVTAMLVQEGLQHWAEIKVWLSDPERYVRRASWDLLRRALSLPFHRYDANADPSRPGWMAIDEAYVIAALRARRSP